jgi:succinyl-CoA synthetase beta subunit
MLPHLRYLADTVEGEFIQAISSVDHKSMPHPKPCQALGHQVQAGEHADHLRPGSCRISKRAGQIEDGAEAQCPADRLYPLHGRMQGRSIEKHKAGLAQALHCLRRLQPNRDPECLQDIGRTALRGNAPVAMLGYLNSCRGRHQSSSSRDIEGSLAIASRSAGIDQLFPFDFSQGDVGAHRAHRLHKARQLFHRGAAARDSRQKRGDLDIRRRTLKHLADRRTSLLLRKGAATFDHMLDQPRQFRHPFAPFCPPGQSPLVWKFCPKTKRMKIHEYQAKDILERYGVAVPRGEVANTLEESLDVARRLFTGGAKGVVVKAQIHAGGRGKGGGVKVAKTLAQAEEYSTQILGMQLVTHQTGPQGQKVQRLLIEEMSPIARELYLGIVLDRATAKLVFMASQAGGMEIEEVAAKDPDAIFKAYIDPAVGFQPYQARKLAFALGLKPAQINDAVKFMTGLYKVFLETDASLLEINPFITTTDDRLLALDCKINFDDNAMFRHKELKELRDTAEEDPLEVEASKYALNYIKLDGNIACMVNGAGLAMATMDIIQYAGGSPANFLDVGGGANQQQIEHAFEILLSDQNVQAVFINIFGGILRVDTLAHGVVEAAKKTNVQVPVVLRLEGTNVEQGREILKNSGLNFIIGETMQDAAAKVVAAAKEKASRK